MSGKALATPAGMVAPRIFLLSPAHCGGKRAWLLRSGHGASELARRLRGEGPPPTLGEVFAFVSGLYFRGKLTYAAAFAAPPPGFDGVLVITPTRGLMSPETPADPGLLDEFATTDIATADAAYRAPLERDVAALAARLPDGVRVVLLGSVATGKYVDVLDGVLGTRLEFPVDFVGRGDMSRGGLLLRAAQAGTELPYASVRGAVRRGRRPPRLAPRG